MSQNFSLSPLSLKVSSRSSRYLSPKYTLPPYLPSKSLKSISKQKTPTNEAKSYFPDWLLNRKDFINSLTIEDLSLNPAQICIKPYSQRDTMERSALKLWTEECEFFKHLTDHSANEVRKKLSTVYLKKGETLIREGDESECMFIICTGVAEIFKNNVGISENIVAKNTVGESGIKNNQKRSATVIAKTDISALMLRLEDYDDIVRRQKYREKFEMVDYLKSLTFFCNFFNSKLETIAYNLFTMQYFKGQTIYASDEEPINFYIIKKGSVKFEKKVAFRLKSRFPGSEKKFIRKRVYTKVMRECHSGEFFGEEEIIMNVNRKSRVVCSSDRTILWILKKDFFVNIFNEKDQQKMLDEVKNRPNTNELNKKVKNEFVDEVNKLSAIMDATQLSNSPNGRLFQSRRLGVINGIINRHNKFINQQLLSDRIFIE